MRSEKYAITDTILQDQLNVLLAKKKYSEVLHFLNATTNFQRKQYFLAKVTFSASNQTDILPSLKFLIEEPDKDFMYWILLCDILTKCIDSFKDCSDQDKQLKGGAKLFALIKVCIDFIQDDELFKQLEPEIKIEIEKIEEPASNYLKEYTNLYSSSTLRELLNEGEECLRGEKGKNVFSEIENILNGFSYKQTEDDVMETPPSDSDRDQDDFIGNWEDSFFDAVAKGLNQLLGKTMNVKDLRLVCHQYANDPNNTWVKDAINPDSQNKDNNRISCEKYLERLQFTAKEIADRKRKGIFDKKIAVIEGDPIIEGQMIFSEYKNLQLHVTEIFENPKGKGKVDYLIGANGICGELDPIIDDNNDRIIHIVSYNNRYFYPLLNATVQHATIQSNDAPESSLTANLITVAGRNNSPLHQNPKKSVLIETPVPVMPEHEPTDYVRGSNVINAM